METEFDAHTLLRFILHHEMRRTLQVDVHWKASTERMRGDTDLRFCTYTCTGLTRFPLCRHFATWYSFPGKNQCRNLMISPRTKQTEGSVYCKFSISQFDCFSGWLTSSLWIHDIQLFNASNRPGYKLCSQDILYVSRQSKLKDEMVLFFLVTLHWNSCEFLWGDKEFNLHVPQIV